MSITVAQEMLFSEGNLMREYIYILCVTQVSITLTGKQDNSIFEEL